MKRILLNLFGVLAAGLVLGFQLSTAFAQSTGFTLLTTFTNPTPVVGDYFGFSVAAVGNDRVLIGSVENDMGVTNAGAAYLFSTNGALLATFTNPIPTAFDYFGNSVAAVGADRILIGAYGHNAGARAAGAAYLFSTSGTLITTFTNPTPADFEFFGCSVAVVGTDRVLIGAYGDDTGATAGGVAYLFSTNGVLLVTLKNPTPAADDAFGYSVAAVGTDRVLIGASGDDTGATDAGAAYLFSTDGTLLTTFTNPTPVAGDSFGSFVAAAGIDQVLIGARGDDTGATNAGAAYLFSTGGTLLTTFTNPTPVNYDAFGRSGSALGTDRIVIAAHQDDSGAVDAGAVYLFSTNGTLLTTITNPAPADGDWLGYSVAVIGSGWVLIGALGDDAGVKDAGTVYLFSLAASTPPAPSLTIRLTSTNTVAVSWLSPSTDWTLQENTNGLASVNWSNASGTIQDDGVNKTLIINPPTGNRFYRLFKP